MHNPKGRALHVRSLPFSPEHLKAWVNRDHTLLRRSSASPFICDFIPFKASRRLRRTSRFFGEALVATKTPHVDGWYASFKWLTARHWVKAKGQGDSVHEAAFRFALHEHIGAHTLRIIQDRARQLQPHLKGDIPVPPDLWLFTGAEHHFIEVKRPPDAVSDTQLAGLALLATCLPVSMTVRCELVVLHPEGSRPRDTEGAEELTRFDRFQSLLRRRA